MRLLRRGTRFLKRLFSGDDIVLIRQTPEHWERQFRGGAWDRLVDDQPNTLILRDHIVDLLAAKGALSVLDVGCGNGGLARLLRNHPGISYCGIDISSTAIETARAFAPGARFVAGDAKAPPADLGLFDVIVFNEVLYYFDPEKALSLYRAHAKPGAALLISVVRSWRSPFIWDRIKQAVEVKEKRGIRDTVHAWDIAMARYGELHRRGHSGSSKET